MDGKKERKVVCGRMDSWIRGWSKEGKKERREVGKRENRYIDWLTLFKFSTLSKEPNWLVPGT